MGKRKLHGTTYYQCDWSGIPLASGFCHMPSWLDGKLHKKGNYCNWESVLAHASFLHNQKEIDDATVQKVYAYVTAQTGGVTPNLAPSFTELEHFKADGMNIDTYHSICCFQHAPICAVKIPEEGNPFEILLEPTNGSIDFSTYLKKPPLACRDTMPSMFSSYRKQKKDTEICIYSYPGRNGFLLNTLASNLFKVQIYGEVIITQVTKEQSFRARERYVAFTLPAFEETFQRKRKRSDSAEAGAEIRKFEKRATASALKPGDFAKSVKLPPADGKAIARMVKAQRTEMQTDLAQEA